MGKDKLEAVEIEQNKNWYHKELAVYFNRTDPLVLLRTFNSIYNLSEFNAFFFKFGPHICNSQYVSLFKLI